MTGNPDFPPTDQEKTVLKFSQNHLHTMEGEYTALMTKNVPAFDKELMRAGAQGGIILNLAKVGQ